MEKAGPGEARVEADIRAGSVVLAGPQGRFRLVWKEGDRRRKRPLPRGTYRLRDVRAEGTHEGVHWFFSSSGPWKKARRIEVEGETKLEVGDTVHVRVGSPGFKDGKLRIGFALLAADGRGLSIYRDGKRVPVGYRVLDKEGAVLAEGTMRYG